MQHWIVMDRDFLELPAWQQAFPEGLSYGRNQLDRIGAGEAGVLWYRLRAGEDVASLLPPVKSAARNNPLVVLSDVPDEVMVLSALAAGAAGCCNTHAAPEVLKQVALVVGNGGLWVGQALLQQLVTGTAQALTNKAEPLTDDWSTLLSEREIQVVRLVAGGASNKEIARQLDITERTVKAHLTAVFEKLGVRDRLQLSLRVNGLRV